MPGLLSVVATPIGNLEDISARALRTLREADVIAVEDTRRTAKLLSRYDIHRPMVSLHAHNEYREAPRLIQRLKAGEHVALVSDAGTPGISDPGAELVRLAHKEGIRVSPIPGPSAVMAALSVSGRPASEFVFMGFPPHSGAARQRWLERATAEIRLVVAFEAPHRLTRLLLELKSYGIRQIDIFRELTKIFEQSVIWPNEAAVETSGEFVVIFSREPDELDLEQSGASAVKLFGCMTDQCKIDEHTAIRLSSRAYGVTVAELRKRLKKERIQRRRAEQDLS